MGGGKFVEGLRDELYSGEEKLMDASTRWREIQLLEGEVNLCTRGALECVWEFSILRTVDLNGFQQICMFSPMEAR